jgi:predicted  nucleic acid-binding Zn-ribbon protein
MSISQEVQAIETRLRNRRRLLKEAADKAEEDRLKKMIAKEGKTTKQLMMKLREVPAGEALSHVAAQLMNC